MIGKCWTNKTPIVRLSFVAPLGLFLVGPLVRRATGRPISLAGAIGCALLIVAWMGFVAWRVAINAHRQGSPFDQAR